ncbi:hypothetical protein HNQ40_002808 [Algisphaera agarilytica]|uniref:Uncharacterized protein n=1 Tax=Algisphaera agarilytica TaxID=1385975 RepID=A0A7X0H8I0_9BACT|nr:hypothetical protein [Algisphaera agarilytica]MBB6431002.1 hypothetical protein [Algisphaera agarilytica]
MDRARQEKQQSQDQVDDKRHPQALVQEHRERGDENREDDFEQVHLPSIALGRVALNHGFQQVSFALSLMIGGVKWHFCPIGGVNCCRNPLAN